MTTPIMSVLRLITAYVPSSLRELLPAGAVAAPAPPPSAGGGGGAEPERVLWCALQWVDGWAPAAAAGGGATPAAGGGARPWGCGGPRQRRLVAALATSGGFQLWDATASAAPPSVTHSPDGGGGGCAPRELASVRGAPLKLAHALAAAPSGAGEEDAFAATRPLVALAAATDSAEFPAAAVKIFSMATCKCGVAARARARARGDMTAASDIAGTSTCCGSRGRCTASRPRLGSW